MDGWVVGGRVGGLRREHQDRRIQVGVGRQLTFVRVVGDRQLRLIGAELSDGIGPLRAGFAEAEKIRHGLGDGGGQGGY